MKHTFWIWFSCFVLHLLPTHSADAQTYFEHYNERSFWCSNTLQINADYYTVESIAKEIHTSGQQAIRISKRDSAGELTDSLEIGGKPYFTGSSHAFDTLPNGNFLMVGSSEYLPFKFKGEILCINADLSDTLFTSSFLNGNESVTFDGFIQIADTIIAYGSATATQGGLSQPLFVRFLNNGQVLSSSTVSLSGGFRNRLQHMYPTPDNRFIGLASSSKYESGNSYLTHKTNLLLLDSNLNLISNSLYGSNINNSLYNALVPTADGNYICASGYADSLSYLSGSSGTWIGRVQWRKYSPNGTMLWEIFTGGNQQQPSVKAIVNTNFGYASTGSFFDTTAASGHVTAIDFSGNQLWLRRYKVQTGNHPQEFSQATSLITTNDGGFLLSGTFYSFPGSVYPNGHQSAWLLKLDGVGCSAPVCSPSVAVESLPTSNKKLSIFPNPSSDGVFQLSYEGTITKIEVYDQMGQRVLVSALRNARYFDGSSLPEGHYFVVAYTDQGAISSKVLLLP